MIVLTNCLTQNPDEGCLKVAVSLVKRIKENEPQTTVIGYERQCPLCDIYLPLNKLMLNRKLMKLLRKEKQDVLFAPFSAKMRSTALRTLVVSILTRGKVLLLQPMFSPMGRLEKLFIKLSGARMLCLSQKSWRYYRRRLGKRAVYLKSGVDTQRFTMVLPEEKAALRKKYGLPEDKPIVLHVGHLKPGRNEIQFLKLDSKYHGLLVNSTHTPEQQDAELRQTLKAKENLTLIDGYVPNIEEIYRLSDVYLFPVEEKKSCIDVPLSALEAAACGIPVVTTPFGEMETLLCNEGFYQIESFEATELNALLQTAIEEKKNPRAAVLPYDWNNAVKILLKM